MSKLLKYDNIFNSKRRNGAASLGAPDPFIYRFNGSYYLICTRDRGLVMMKSDDLINFQYVNEDGIVSEDKSIAFAYAPELSYLDGYFYITASPSGNGHYIYRSENICGPYVLYKDNFNELIDGSFYIDTDESKYFLRATETGIAAKKFKEDDSLSDFELFSDDSFYFNNTIIGNWTEGPYMLKRYGYYYLTYTGTHFLSDAYRVVYSSGKSFSEDGLSFKGTTLLSTTNDFYGLGHSMTFLGPDLDSYYIAYHNMTKSGNRYLNISRLVFDDYGNMMTNGAYVKDNPGFRRPIFEKYVDESNYISNEVFENKRFTVEYNFKGSNVKLYLAYVDSNNYQYIVVNNGLKIVNYCNGNSDILLDLDLNSLGNPNVFHCLRLQYYNKKATIYLDNVEIVNKTSINVNKGKIGFVNNEFIGSYLAYSIASFGSSDKDIVKKDEFYISNCNKKNDNYITKFRISEDGCYMIYLHANKKTILKNIFIDNNLMKEDVSSLIDNTLLFNVSLKKGIHKISFLCDRISSDLKIKIVKCEDNPIINIDNFLENSNIYHRYLKVSTGIYLENDRNAIISKNKYSDFSLSTNIKLIGNPQIKDRFVGLIACCNNYSKSNEFENGYSLQGYMLVIDRNYAYVIDANYYHSKVLKKYALNGKREMELKVVKTLTSINFYVDDELIYNLDGNKYISGYCGIYNHHVSAVFRKFDLKNN